MADAAGRRTLRAAIMEANAHVGADTMVLAAGTYELSIAGTGEEAAATGDLDIAGNLTIVGSSADTTIIDANQLDRVIDVQSGATLQLTGATLTGGKADQGAGLLVRGTATVTSSKFTANNATTQGGGLCVQSNASASVTGSTLSANTGPIAAALVVHGNATLGLTNSTVSDNVTSGSSTILDNGALTIAGSTIANNTASIYAAIGVGGTLTLTNSTVSGNLALNHTGGLSITGGTVTATNSTITRNRSTNPGVGGVLNEGTFTVKNTIIAGNLSPSSSPDIGGSRTFTSLGHNLIGSGVGGTGFTNGVNGDIVGTSDNSMNPLLTPLQNNGGPTLTHLPLPGSPVIDAGDNAGAPATDQIGTARPQDGNGDGTVTVDIGAVERYWAEIDGRVFHDRNRDGSQAGDGSEPGLTGWTVYLDLNQNGALDGGEPSTATNANGDYAFTGLVPGTYAVAEVPQAGWETLPSLPCALFAGQVLTGINFTNHFFNHSPVLADTNLDVLLPLTSTASLDRGTLLSNLIGGITDADTGDPRGIAITAADSTHGTLQYSTDDGGTWTSVGSVSNASALLLAADANTRLRYRRSDGQTGPLANVLTFRAWDRAEGSVGQQVSTTTNGLDTAFSAATDTLAATFTTCFWDGAASDGLWASAANWNDDTLPTSTSDVLIDMAGEPTVAITGGAVSLRRLYCAEAMTIASGSLTVTDDAYVAGAFGLSDGASVTASGAGVSFAAAGPVAAVGASFNAKSGATIALPALTSYVVGVGSSPISFLADGTGSLLDLPNLATITNDSNGGDLYLKAVGGGHVHLPAVMQISTGGRSASAHGVRAIASGNGSQVDLSRLTDFVDTCYGPTSEIEETNQGRVLVDHLTRAIGLAVRVTDGHTVSLPSLTTYQAGAGILGSMTLSAEGAGSVLQFPSLTTITNDSDGSDLYIKALGGGRISLPAVTRISSGAGSAYAHGVQVLADGAGSLVDLSALRQVVDATNGSGRSAIAAAAQGIVTLNPASVSLQRVDISTGANGLITAGVLIVETASTFQGSGILRANVQNNSVLNARTPPGTLTIDGDFTQTETGILNIEVGGTTPGVQYEQLQVTGRATLAGTLNLTAINGFTPVSGQVFQPLDFAAHAGQFAQITGIGLHAGLGWQPTYNATNLTLTAAFVVNSTMDSVDANPGDGIAADVQGRTTLRAAIMEANAHPGPDTILLGAGTYELSITGADEDAAATGDLDIAGDLTILGAGQDVTIMDANQLDRVFDVRTGVQLTVSDLTVTGGRLETENGGGFRNAGSLTLQRTIVTGNAAFYGGGVDSTSTVEVVDSSFVANAGIYGGAISGAGNHGGTVTIRGSRFEGNTATGGGVLFDVGGTIETSTFSHNTAVDGGAICNVKTLTIRNSTFSDNAAQEEGGAIVVTADDSSLMMVGCTVSGNTAAYGGGFSFYNKLIATFLNCTIVDNFATASAGAFSVSFPAQRPGHAYFGNSIVAGNTAGRTDSPQFIGGSFEDFLSLGHNFIGDVGTWPIFVNGRNGDIVGGGGRPVLDPQLGPLQDNGGPTWTRVPLPGSPVIDTGSNADVAATDARGAPRVLDGNNDGTAAVDIGAVEYFPASYFFVDSFEDTVDAHPGDGIVADASGHRTLRAAIMETNALPGAQTIILAAGTYELALVGADEDAAGSGDLDITGQVTMIGAGADATTIDANQLDRVFEVFANAKLALVGLTVTGGHLGMEHGGGIRNWGDVTVDHCIIADNHTDYFGGGIYNDEVYDQAKLAVVDSVFRGNSAEYGGALYGGANNTIRGTTFTGNTATRIGAAINYGGGLIEASTFSANVVGYWGGAIYNNQRTLTIRGSTFTGNVSAGLGAAILDDNGGSLTIDGCTFSGNHSQDGSNDGIAFVNTSTATITNTTIVVDANTGVSGSGIWAGRDLIRPDKDVLPSVYVGNSIVVSRGSPAAASDVVGDFHSLGHNFIGVADGSTGFSNGVNGDHVGTVASPLDPQLGPLADNGGPTLTHVPLPGSPVIDAGDNTLATATDQVGTARPQDGNSDGTATVDIGAVERYYGEIRGQIYQDLNGNGTLNSGEPGIAGRTVYLDANDNGGRDLGEMATVTDADGNYWFALLAPGNHVVRQVLPPGWEQISPLTLDFATATTVPVGGGPDGIAAGDFNRDGFVDLAVADTHTQQLSILLGDGSGAFPTSREIVLGNAPRGVRCADFNGDGILDVVTANLVGQFGSGVSVLMGRGDGTFAEPRHYLPATVSSVSVDLADVDADGDIDIIVASDLSNPLAIDGINVLYNDGLGYFTDWYLQSCRDPVAVTAGDLNLDGDVDFMAVCRALGDTTTYHTLGVGVFDITGGPLNFPPDHALLADMDGDGSPDLVYASRAASKVEVLAGRGDGFVGGVLASVAVNSPEYFDVRDVDTDGDLDVAVVSPAEGRVTLLLNDGRGALTVGMALTLDGPPQSVLVTDVNGDGAPDLIVSGQTEDRLAVFLSQSGTCRRVSLLPGAIVADRDFGDTVSVSIAESTVTVTEGDSASSPAMFTVRLSAASNAITTVDYATSDLFVWRTGSTDYATASGTLTFAPGETVRTIPIAILGDTIDEDVETFFVELSNAHNARIADRRGLGRILDNDAAPTLSVGDVAVTEGDLGSVSMVFTASLSAATERGVSFSYATANGTASAGLDYEADAGTAVIAPGQTSVTIPVTVHGDFLYEPGGEQLVLNLFNPFAATLADSQAAGTILDDDPLLTVNSMSDKIDLTPGNGIVDTGTANEITLRAAIMEANGLAGPDAIVLPAGTYRLTITGTSEDAAAKGDLDILPGGLTITGAGAGSTSIDAAGLDRVFEVRPGATLTLIGVTIKGGHAKGTTNSGGGIENLGSLVLIDCVLDANTADGAGGGVDNHGSLSLTRTTFSNNIAHDGGAVQNVDGAVLTATDSVFQSNTAQVYGGAVVAGGTLTFTRTTFRGNRAAAGGVLLNNGELWLTDSTLVDNVATGPGGGIFDVTDTGTINVSGSSFLHNTTGEGGGAVYLASEGPVNIINSTFTQNIASLNGGAIDNEAGVLALSNVTLAGNSAAGYGGGLYSASTTTLLNTLIAQNSATADPDVGGDCTSLGHNLLGRAGAATGFSSSLGDLLGTAGNPLDPLLRALEDNGGPTLTMALQPGSPALDHGSNQGAPATDQRGFRRPEDGDLNGLAVADIGAYELSYNLPPVIPDQTFLVDENGALGASVGFVQFSGPEADDVVSLSLLSGNTNDAFSLNPQTGQVTVAGPLDHEQCDAYQLTIRGEDRGHRVTIATIAIQINDLNESPVLIGSGITDRTRPDGTTTETVSLTSVFADPDAGDVLTYTAVSSNPALVDVTVQAGGMLLFTYHSYTAAQDRTPAAVTVTATDQGGLHVSNRFTVTVTPTKTFEYDLVVVAQPTPQSEVTILPTSLSSVATGGTFYVEVWLRDLFVPGLTGLLPTIVSQGVLQGAMDVTFQPDLSLGQALDHTGIFDLSTSYTGAIDQGAGVIENFGGKALLARKGVTPNYGRLGIIQFTATSQGQQVFGLHVDGQVTQTSRTATGAAANGKISPSQLLLAGPVSVTIVPQGGSVPFGPAIPFSAGTNPTSLALADLDGDGVPDVAASNGSQNQVSLLWNTPGFSQTVQLSDGEVATEINFGDRAVPGQIRGRVFQDVDRDGQRQSFEPGLPGVVVYLDQNGDGQWQAGEPSRTTDGTGLYTFTNLPALTTYTVAEVVPGGGSQSRPAGDGLWRVYVGPGAVITDVDFGNAFVGGVSGNSITGSLFLDNDGDGKRDSGAPGEPGEPWLAGLTVFLDLNDNGTLDANEPTTVTLADAAGTPNVDESGTYEFPSLGAGTYRIRVAAPGNLRQTYPLGNSFTTTELRADGGPRALAVGDFNADNQIDLAVANSLSNTVSILTNRGASGFTTGAAIPVGLGASSVVSADLNGDHHDDLAVTNAYSGNVSILLNRGDGSFAAAQAFPTGIGPSSIAAGDFDGDHDVDLAVANDASNSVTVLFNDGAGRFGTRLNYATDDSPVAVAAVDLNEDGYLDLAAANIDSNNVTLLINDQHGRFVASANLPVGNSPFALVAADFNGDGRSDLAAANVLSDNISILLNQGDGWFAAAETYPGGKGPSSLAAADMDHDGAIDLVVTNGSGTNLSILRNRGDGTFSDPTSFGQANFPTSLPLAVIAADIDRNGAIDLAVANGDSDNVSVLTDTLVAGAQTVVLTGVDSVSNVNFGAQRINLPPTLDPIGNLTVREDAAEQSLTLTGISAGTGETQTLQITVSSDSSSLIPTPAIAYAATQTTGQLRFRPVADQSGTAVITVIVMDGGLDDDLSTVDDNRSTVRSCTITVTAVNDQPLRTAGSVLPLTVQEDAGTASLALNGLAYGPGGGADEVGQTLSYAVTAVPPASLGVALLSDGTTVVAPGVYTLAQLQELKFRPAANANGSSEFRFRVQDTGSTANGGTDALDQTLAISVTAVNDPPVQIAGSVLPLTVQEDAGTASLALNGLAYGPGGGADEVGQTLGYTVTAVPPASLGVALLSDGTTVVAPGVYTLAQLQELKFHPAANANGSSEFHFRAQDTGSTANGGTDTLDQTLAITVTAVNDPPVQIAGSVLALTVKEDSGTASLALSGLAYGPGGGADEVEQTLGYTVTAVPPASLGVVLLSDGTTVVASGVYTLAQLQELKFRPAANANGSSEFHFRVQDTGSTANGGTDTLDQTLAITVTAVNDPPVQIVGSVLPLTVKEDSGTSSLALSGLAYGPGGGADEVGQTLSCAVTAVPPASLGVVLLSDGTTVVAPGVYTLAQLQELKFRPAADANGASEFHFRVQDTGSTANGGSDALDQILVITVTAVNDPPVRTGGSVLALTVKEDSGTSSLALSGLAYGPGGGADEVGQTLSYAVTAVPASSLGDVLLSDGTTVVTPGFYTLAQLQELKFRPAAHVNGQGEFRFRVQDNGSSENGGSDRLDEVLTIYVSKRDNVAPTEITLSANIVTENALGSAIGDVVVTDPNAGDSQTLAVSDSRFEIVAGQLQLKAGQMLDFEVEPSVVLDITATDTGGLNLTKAFTVFVTNVNEAPTSIALDPASVDEHVAGAAIGWLSAVDPDAGDAVVFAVSDNRFEVVDRQLKLKAGQSLAGPQAVSVEVTATDRGQLSRQQTLQILVTANPSPWRNRIAPLDVDHDGAVAPRDVLTLISELNSATVRDAQGHLPVARTAGSDGAYFDPNGDGFLTPSDVLTVINYLNGYRGSGEGEASPSDVPPVDWQVPSLAASPAGVADASLPQGAGTPTGSTHVPVVVAWEPRSRTMRPAGLVLPTLPDAGRRGGQAELPGLRGDHTDRALGEAFRVPRWDLDGDWLSLIAHDVAETLGEPTPRAAVFRGATM